jgi:hypothetical protein
MNKFMFESIVAPLAASAAWMQGSTIPKREIRGPGWKSYDGKVASDKSLD